MLKIINNYRNIDIVDLFNLDKNGFTLGVSIFGMAPSIPTLDPLVTIDGNILGHTYYDLSTDIISPPHFMSDATLIPLNELYTHPLKWSPNFVFHEATVEYSDNIVSGTCHLEKMSDDPAIRGAATAINLIMWSVVSPTKGIYPLNVVSPMDLGIKDNMTLGSTYHRPEQQYGAGVGAINTSVFYHEHTSEGGKPQC